MLLEGAAAGCAAAGCAAAACASEWLLVPAAGVFLQGAGVGVLWPFEKTCAIWVLCQRLSDN